MPVQSGDKPMVEHCVVRYARQKVEGYTSDLEGVIGAHHEAMDCLDCEAHLQMGIDAFRGLIWADETIRKAVYNGRVEHHPEIDEALRLLFRAWLKPCGDAEKWIATQHARSFAVDNYEEFLRCRDETRAIIASFGDDSLRDGIADLRDQALADHRDGKTTEFLDGV